jgi:diaminopimelate epimerase
VFFQQGVEGLDVDTVGARIRYNSTYKELGINVNFAERIDDYLLLRTYERGVEAETSACGTGATATAIAAFEKGLFTTTSIKLKVKGGHLEVSFVAEGDSYSNICLTGSAEFVFSGEIEINV